jgi:hypothetical protein
MCNRHIRDDLEDWHGSTFFAYYMFIWHVTRPLGSTEEKVCASAINIPCADLSSIEDTAYASFPEDLGQDGIHWTIAALEEQRLKPCHKLANAWCALHHSLPSTEILCKLHSLEYVSFEAPLHSYSFAEPSLIAILLMFRPFFKNKSVGCSKGEQLHEPDFLKGKRPRTRQCGQQLTDLPVDVAPQDRREPSPKQLTANGSSMQERQQSTESREDVAEQQVVAQENVPVHDHVQRERKEGKMLSRPEARHVLAEGAQFVDGIENAGTDAFAEFQAYVDSIPRQSVLRSSTDADILSQDFAPNKVARVTGTCAEQVPFGNSLNIP